MNPRIIPRRRRAPPIRSKSGLFNEYLAGLREVPKRLSCKFFYDEEGARLFDRICTLEEYYPTRTELAILRDHLDEVAEFAGEQAALVELGSGSSEKGRVVLEHLRAPAAYVPVEISGEQLSRSCAGIQSDFPGLHILPVCTDYTRNMSLPSLPPETRGKLLFFPGSTLGNFEPNEALTFMTTLARVGGEGGALLIGVDLKKDRAVLEAAYNDSEGVTSAFNLNILARANREFGADFNLDQFRHRALYDSFHSRIEMQLESLCEQEAHLGGERIRFAENERITTEYSYKYSVGAFRALARLAGFTPRAVWTDREKRFSLHYLTVA